MTLKNRIELKAKFKNGLRPSEGDFADVVVSTLNKRDDQFFGKWRAGTVYRKGDVVIYKRTLWVLKADQDVCSHTSPKVGDEWQTLYVPVGDEDWILVIDPDHPEADPEVMYATPSVACVGIGTYDPKATLDVVDDGDSRFLLGPKAGACATFTIVNLKGEDKTYVLTGLDSDSVSWVSDVPGGFVFRHGEPCDEGDEDQLDGHGTLLMVVQPDAEGLVRVGIGTDKPDAMLDVTDEEKGQFLFNTADKQDPAFTIVNLDPDSDQNYLASGVGVEKAVFVTDAPDGFVFNRGGEYSVFGHEENINQGKLLVCISPEAKMGVGMEPEDYQLDLNGLIRAYTLYLNTDRNKLKDPKKLGSVLASVMELRPMTFRWRVVTGLAEEGEQIGLIAQQVDEVFPQVVKTNRDGTKAVAYPNLVAVVVRAVQEQQVLLVKQQAAIEAQQALNQQQQQQINQQKVVNAEQQEQLTQLQEENAQQQKQIDAQQALNKRQQAQLEAQHERLEKQQQQIEEQHRVNERQQQQLDEQQENIRQLRQEVLEEQAVNQKQEERLADHETRIEELEQGGGEPVPPDDELQAQIAELRAENERQQQEIAEQQTVNAEQQQQIAEQQTVNVQQKEQIAEQQAANATQQRQIDTQEQRIERMQQQINAILEQLRDPRGGGLRRREP